MQAASPPPHILPEPQPPFSEGGKEEKEGVREGGTKPDPLLIAPEEEEEEGIL